MAAPAVSYLEVEGLLEDLPGRSARSAFVRLGSQAITTLLYVASGMILARLLTPEDFGVFAMAATLIAFVAAFRDFGFPMATVQREELDHRDVSALFWLSLRLNALTALFVAAMAPALAWFYREPRLLMVTLVLAGCVFAYGLGFQHEGLLTRKMRFGTLTVVETGSLLGGVASGVAAALLGAGYWALVVQFLVFAALRSGGLWAAFGWRPDRASARRQRHTPAFRALISYGGRYTAYRVLTHIGNQLDRILVGYFAGAGFMGHYHNAVRWSRYPVVQLYTPLHAVAVAGLSRVRDDPAAFRALCRRAFLPVFALVLPALAFMTVEARNVILVLLGGQWLAAVPLFRLLCAAAVAESAVRLTDWLYLAEDRTGRQLRWGMISTPVMVLAVAVGVPWGPRGIALGYTVGTWLLAGPAIVFCLAGSRLGIRDFGAALWRPASASATAAALLLAVDPLLPAATPLRETAVRLALFTVTYGAWWIAPSGGREATLSILRAARLVLPRRSADPRALAPRSSA